MNGKQHRQIGAAFGVGYAVIRHFYEKQKDSELEFNWGDLLLNAGIGYLLGSLPDWIEPATNPNHRKFFHSVVAGSLVVYGAFGKHSENWDDQIKKLIQSAALPYISHLAADSIKLNPRSKGIALIHPNLI